eukprot:7308969-Prymnesium_polylepis.1
MGMHTQRAGAAIGWRSRLSLARVRGGRALTSPVSARSVLESARLASHASCVRDARAQKQAGGAMPVMKRA